MYKTTPNMNYTLLLHMTASNFGDFFDTLHEAEDDIELIIVSVKCRNAADIEAFQILVVPYVGLTLD